MGCARHPDDVPHGPHRLKRLIARSMPSASQHSTASDIGSSSSPTARHSSRLERAEHEVGELGEPGGTGPDPDAEPRVVLPLQRALDALEPVVAARRARAAQPERPDRQGDVVDQDQQVGGGIEPSRARSGARAAPLRFMYVWGLSTTTGRPSTVPFGLPGPLATAKAPSRQRAAR